MPVKHTLLRAATVRGVVVACLTPMALWAQVSNWRSIMPGGSTRCAFDTPFEFRVSEGDPSRVLLYLQGGGACWDLESCDPRRRAAYDTGVDSTDATQHRSGVFGRTRAANPFRDYTLVFVPYCTGDLHLGARRVTYRAPGDSGAVTVHHAGVDSLMSALGMPLATSGDVIVGMYEAAAARQPRIRFSQVRTSEDDVVGAWLRRVGDDPARIAS